MERRWYDHSTHEIGIAFVSDLDADVLRHCGYEHRSEEDFTDDELDGAIVEIWYKKGDK